MGLQIETIVSMPFYENTYIVWKDSNACLVIDPGMEPELITDFLEERGLKPVAILNTHGHADHIAGNGAMKDRFPDAPLIIGVNDAPLLSDPYLNVSQQYGLPITSPPANQLVREGDVLLFAGLTLNIYDVPGHSPGHVAFYLKDENVIFSGDVLMQGGFGRVDFPGGSFAQLASSIKDKLFKLPPETVVYSGHGPETTIGEEMRTNPINGM
jgi:hydroxyacylglutathione hydrolase